MFEDSIIEYDQIASDIEKNEIVLKKCFACLVKHGLEKTTMRTLCNSTKLTASSLYYRFDSKDRLIMYASCYGLETITKEVFWVAAEKVNDFEGLFRAVFENVELRKKQIRYIYQVATSPRYGEKFCEYTKVLTPLYDKATNMIAEHLSCPSEKLRPYVDLAMSTIREYLIWNNKERAKKQLYMIYEEALKNCVNQ